MYKVTLVEGSNDICFQVESNSYFLGTFLSEVFKRYMPRETGTGMTSLVIEVEYMEDKKENA